MAQLEDAPWVNPQELQDAPWAAQPGVIEDVAKTAPSALAKGIISIPGTPGDLAALAKAGVNKLEEKAGGAPDPLGWLTHKLDENFPNAMKFFRESNAKSANAPAAQAGSGDLPGSYEMPTSKDIQGQVEKVTGKFYEPQTKTGKAVGTGLEVLPSIATGGGPVRGMLAKAVGAGVTSEAAGEGAKSIQGYLPDSVAPYAEPVARAIGSGVGMFTPSVVRRAVTPLPMTDQRVNTVNALRATNPELVNASTAGQLTETPGLMALEGRAPRMANVPERQNEAYTRGVMRQAGSDGMFDAAGLAQAKARGGELDALQNAHTMDQGRFSQLNRDAAAAGAPGSELFKEVGPSKPYQEVVDALRLGPAPNGPWPKGIAPGTPPGNMTGQRYGALKQILQNAGEAAPTTHEQTAIFDLRRRMQDAFHSSMPPAEAERLRDLDRGYANYKTIEGIEPGVGNNTVTPSQVFKKAPRGSELETHANQAHSVMTPLPAPPAEGSPFSRVLNSLAGGAAGAALGGATGGLSGAGSEGLLGAFMAAGHGKDYVDVAKNAVGRIASRPSVQRYLGNQVWRPGAASVTNRDDLLRLLMAPPAKPYVGSNLGPLEPSQ